jgi:ribosomal protein S18 acetylase RimI-like enzyme
MTQVQVVEENALAYYKGIARLLNGQFVEEDQVAWITTGRRSLGRFNGVLRTVVTKPDDLINVIEPMPAYRGRGLGKALTHAAMQTAQSAGYSTAILFATASGYPLYQRLGFETVAMADLFAWNGND